MSLQGSGSSDRQVWDLRQGGSAVRPGYRRMVKNSSHRDSGRRWGVASRVEELAIHDHVSWTYKDIESWREALTTFFAGAPPTDRLVYTSPQSEREMLADLSGLADVADVIRSGRLRLISHAVPSHEKVAAVRLSIEFAKVLDEAVSGPYTAVRVATRIGSDDLPSTDTAELASALAAFELFVDQLVSVRRAVMLCGVDGRLPAAALDVVRVVHPLRQAPGAAPAEAWLFALDDQRWALAGEVDISNRSAVVDALSSLQYANLAATLLMTDRHLNLRDLEFIDVGGMRALMDLARELTPGQLVLQDATGLLRTILIDVGPTLERSNIRVIVSRG